MILDDARAFFLPLIDLLEPGVEGFSGAGEGEDDIDELLIGGWVDGGMTDLDLLWDLGELAEGGDLSGDFAEALLLFVSLEEEHRDQGGKDDGQVGENLAKAADGHVGNGLPKARGWSNSIQ